SAAYLRATEIEIDAAASPEYPRLEPTAHDLAAASRALVQPQCAAPHLIVIFPGSESPGKNWPADKFAALASKLSLSNRASVAAVLGPAEMSLEPIFRESGAAVLKHLDLPT